MKHLVSGKNFRLVLGLYALYSLLGWLLIYTERLFIGSFDTRDFLSANLIDSGKVGLGIDVVIAAILAPVGEEILFRGFLFASLLSKMSPFTAAFVSSLIFAILHFYSPFGVLSIVIFGMIMCWVYQRTGSLWPCILFHALSNFTLTVSSWYLFSDDTSWLGFYAW